MSAFDCSSEYILENETAFLRPLAADDYNALLPFAIHEPDIWQFSISTPASELGLRKYLEKAVKARKSGAEYPFIIYDKRNARFAGSSRFYDIQQDHRTIQIGYTWLGKEFQRTGLNRHCKFLMFEFAFDAIGFDRVELQADILNARSIAAMKSVGCSEEGVLRSHLMKPDGTRRDSIVFSILKEEWQAGKKEDLLAKLKIRRR